MKSSSTLILVLSLLVIGIPFTATKKINLDGTVGPESLAFDPRGGGPYTGVADGHVLKLDKSEQIPLGIRCHLIPKEGMCSSIQSSDGAYMWTATRATFSSENKEPLYCRCILGSQSSWTRRGMASSVMSDGEGQILRLTNDMDIDDEKDVIYFTGSSTEFNRRQSILSIISTDKTGKLMKYNLTSKQVTVLVRDLAYANGVSLSKDKSFVLISETTTCKIVRYWLEGPNAGTQDTFAELPGFQDNIRKNSEGEFWVGLLPFDFKQLLVGGKAGANALKLSNEGKMLQVLEGKTL